MVITGIHVLILALRYVMFVVNYYLELHPEVCLVKVCHSGDRMITHPMLIYFHYIHGNRPFPNYGRIPTDNEV